jgi:branched-chain amino acid transport system ATP-binding protein
VTATAKHAGRAELKAAGLRIDRLSHSYGALQALNDVTITIPAGTVCAVLGPNGAGKSTLASTIAGVIKTPPGTIRLDDQDISETAAYSRARLGVAFVPEGGAVFPGLTVSENLVVGDQGATRSYRKDITDHAAELFPFIGRRLKERAGMLSGGEQQMVSLSRVLVHDSSLVVIDELSHGLAPAILDQLFEVLSNFRGQKTFVVIEQYVKRAHAIADDVIVLSYGSIAFAGPANTITLTEIEEAYELNDQSLTNTTQNPN